MDTYTKGFIKSAGVVSDTILGGIGSLPIVALGGRALPGIGVGIDTVVPYFAANYDLAKASLLLKLKHIKQLNDSRAKALAPFIGSTRLILRQLVSDAAVKPLIHRTAGALTSLALPIGIGALIGSAKGLTGAAVGAGVGAGVAGIGNLIGIVAALLKRRRTLELHRLIQKNNTAKQYLIPGYAAYDYYKAVGASLNYATPELLKLKDSKLKSDKQKDSKQSLLKQAKKDYTPYLWRKYTTPDLRQTLSNALRKLTQKLKQRLIARILMGGPVTLTLGTLTAAATPTWDLLRLKQLTLDLNYATKATLIPVYDAYNTLKAMGTQRGVQNRVLRLAKKSKALKQNKEDSKLKLKQQA